MFISEKIRQIKPSVTLAAATKARALKKSGKDVVSLTVGEPDFRTPQHISDAAIASITSGAASYYTPTAGIPELIQAIIQRTETDYGLTYQENNIVVTDGAKFALYALFQAILEKKMKSLSRYLTGSATATRSDWRTANRFLLPDCRKMSLK